MEKVSLEVMVKIDWWFPAQVLIALIVVGGIGAYPIVRYGSNEILGASLLGAFLATVNVLLGYLAIEYSFGKSITTFFKVVIGGMGIRMLLMALVLVFAISLLHVHAMALVGSMGIFYIVFLTLEVLFIQKKLGRKKES